MLDLIWIPTLFHWWFSWKKFWKCWFKKGQHLGVPEWLGICRHVNKFVLCHTSNTSRPTYINPHVSLLEGSADMFFPLSLSVRPSVPLSVTKSCPLYNLQPLRDISTKLYTLVKHIQTTCNAQEPELCFGYFWSYFPLINCNAFLCPLYNLITVRGISTKLHTFDKHIKKTCHAQEP